MKLCAGIMTVCAMISLFPVAAAAAPDDVAERRAEVVDAAARGAEALPLLQRALRDDNPMVRRAAIRGLISLGAPAEDAVRGALGNDDPLVRRAALMAVIGEPAPDDLPRIETALEDEDASVREIAVRLLLAMDSATDRVVELLEMAEQDDAPRVHKPAGLRLAELDPEAVPFEVDPPDTAPLRERPEMADRINKIETVFEMRLPSEGWRFRTDTRQRGHREEWFAEDYDDSDDEWSDAEIETAWATGYVGVGWYRREIELPERPEHMAAELLFEGVDESAWVWVNGEYVGGQDVGPGGWNRPFRVDVTDRLRWGDVNQITVRAMNTAAAGGIWKPITLEALAVE
ncbi:MAG: HEAT repeat domain-containing protein [Armatimonadota bacterium]